MLDSSLGKLMAGSLPRPKPPGACQFRKVLFIRPGGIGDVVHLVPALSLFKRYYPDCEIDILVEQRNRGVLGLCSDVSRIYCYDRFSDMLSLVCCCYDIIIDTEQWHRFSAVVTRLLRSDWKIGYTTNERGRLFTHGIDYFQNDYEIFSFYRLLVPLGISAPQEVPAPFLTIPDPERSAIRRLLKDFEARPFVALFPGASIAERRWGTEKFHQLAIKINGDGYPVVVVGGQEDREPAEEIIAGCKGLNLAGLTSLAGSAAVVERSVLLVSGDSGVLHIGVGLGTPTVSLFGPGIADKWAPRGEQHIVINHKLACSPCTRFGTTPPCPIGVQCLRDITVEEVFVAAQKLLNAG